GANQMYTITPASGFQIATLTVDGVSLVTASSYTFSNVLTAHTIAATFSIITTSDTTAPVITLTGGTVTLTTGQTYNDPGFTVVDAVDGTCTLGATDTTSSAGTCKYSILNQSNTSIVGTYIIVYSAIDSSGNHTSKNRTVIVNAPSSYDITINQVSNGSILPEGVNNILTVNLNASQQFSIIPEAGFKVYSIIVDSTPIVPTVFDSNNSTIALYTFSNVTSVHTISASFIAAADNIPPVITITQVNGLDDVTIVVGSVSTYTDAGATALDNPGNINLTSNIVVVGVSAVNTQVVGDYNIRYNVSDAHLNPAVEMIRVVHIVYAEQYRIDVTTGNHGNIISDVGTADQNGTYIIPTHSNPTFTLTPDSGFKVATIIIDNANQSLLPADGINTYNFNDVVSNHTIAVTFTSATAPAPVIVFTGGSDPYLMNTMTVFSEPGVTASITDADDSIRDLTSSIIVTGLTGVNNQHYGSSGNKITYTVTDNVTGATSTKDRIINVVDVTLPIISGIATPATTPTAVGIVWKTDELTDGVVWYGTQSGSLTTESLIDSTPATSHFISLVGLTANTTYYYVIHSKDVAGNEAVSSVQTVQTVDSNQTVSVNVISGVLQSVYDSLLQEKQNIENKIKDQVTELPVITNSKISEITSFTAIISFDSDKETIGAIDYGKNEDYGKNVADFAFAKNHKIKLTGLTMGTDYYFRLKAIDKYGNVGTFSDKNQVFKTKFFSENLPERTSVDNIEQFQSEIDSTIESIVPSLIAPFVQKPDLSDITENSAAVTFKTNIKSYPVVSYSSDSYYTSIVDATTSSYNGEISDTSTKEINHKLQLIGLKPNTKYHVMAKAFSLPQVIGKSEDVVFTTKPAKIVASVADRKKDSFTVVWVTSEPTSSIVEYKNLRNGNIDRTTDGSMNLSHSVKVENLAPGTTYSVNVSGVNDIGNIVEAVEALNVTTSTDVTPPVISRIKIDSALVVGRTDKTQTIVSWKTDEPSTSVVYYEEGSGSPDKALANKQEDTELTLTHTVMLTTLRPGQVYRFQIASSDDANNIAVLPVRTIITPRPNESIVDVIFKNFNETFNFINNVK
ncbi:MAG: DUF5011 domain-containing protein, partial [Candidatus Nomurabacteria bacterium]|nr:DUF5011 domain-containing protein [Candidatus Nomurabacteria bacterium]